jgi:hypothetical protein
MATELIVVPDSVRDLAENSVGVFFESVSKHPGPQQRETIQIRAGR